MQIITVKSGDEIRSVNQWFGDAPIGIVADISDGVVTIVLKNSDADLSSSMHNAASNERRERQASRIVKRRLQRRLEKRRAG